METESLPRILIITHNYQTSSHCAGMIRSELECTIDECLGPILLIEILEMCPIYDGIIFIEANDLFNTFKVKCPHYPCKHTLELTINLEASQVIQQFLVPYKTDLKRKKFIQITQRLTQCFNELPFDIYHQNAKEEYKVLFLSNQKYDGELIKKSGALYIRVDQFNLLKKKLMATPETLIFQSLQQSENVVELLANFEKFALRNFSNINSKIINDYRIYFLHALKICESSSKILSRIEKQFDQGTYYIAHSYLIGLTAMRILTLGQEISPVQFVYICFTAITHDLELEIDNKSKTENKLIEDLESGKLDANYQLSQQLLYHGEKAAKLISNIGTFPLWVLDGLKKHHEKPQGSGFPIGEDIKTYPLEILIFIVSHSIVDYFDQSNHRNISMDEVIKRLNLNNYKSSSLRNHLHAIEKLDIMRA
jgi:hypothetical protein